MEQWQKDAMVNMTQGRLIISNGRFADAGEEIMGHNGLFIYFCPEDKARELLVEYEDIHKEKRCVTPNEATARAVFEMSSTYFGGPTGETKLLNLWTGEKNCKPNFPSPADAVKAGLIGIPFWKDRGMWTTEVGNDIIQNQRFTDAMGYAVLDNAHEALAVNRAAQVLENFDLDF